MITSSPSTSAPIHQEGRTGSSRLPGFRAAAAAVVVYAIIDVAWLEQGWGGPTVTTAFSDISACVCALIATLAALRAYQTEAPERRTPWAFLAGAGAMWALGEIVWTVYELLLQREVPFPSLADIGFLGAYPFAAVAMLTFPTAPNRLTSRARTVLDALVVGSALLFVAWTTFLGPLYRATSGSLIEHLIGIAYPVADVVIASVVIFVVTRAQAGRRTSLTLLAFGLLALAVADSGFAYLTLSDAYATGGPIDAAWDIGYLLIALAAVRHDPGVPRIERNDAGGVGLLLPYAVVLVAIGLAGFKKIQTGTLDGVTIWATLAIVLLVVSRQLVTLLDNISLTRNLESKVDERTVELARSEERHRSLVQNSSDVVTIVDDAGYIRYASPATERVFGYGPERVLGRKLVEIVHPDDRSSVDAYLRRFTPKSGDAPVIEWRIADANGDWLFCESIGANLLDDPTVAGFVLNTRDITERKELELQLRHQAFHDQLTGSANRALFRDRADHALKRAARIRKPIAVLYCDLDNLKTVNDNYGHDVGDKLLALVAGRFGELIRAEDTVARLGGDEFAILLTDSGGEGAARHVAGRLLEALAEPFEIDGHTVRTSASVGIALSWGRQEVDELLRNADLAMYTAKNSGKARYELYQSTTSAMPEGSTE